MTRVILDGYIGNVLYKGFECSFIEEGTCPLPMRVIAEGGGLGMGWAKGRLYRLPRTPYDLACTFMVALSFHDPSGTELDRAVPGHDRWGRAGLHGLMVLDGQITVGAWLVRTDSHECITLALPNGNG